jgi:hypothetical protein
MDFLNRVETWGFNFVPPKNSEQDWKGVLCGVHNSSGSVLYAMSYGYDIEHLGKTGHFQHASQIRQKYYLVDY